MAHWYYKGKTPTPISHPVRGSVIVTPRMKFEAPESAVAHLKSLVVRLPDPPIEAPKSAPVVSSPPVPPAVEETPQNRRSVQGEVETSSDSDGTEGVLESEPTSTQVDAEAEADRESTDSAPPAQEKKTQRRGGRTPR